MNVATIDDTDVAAILDNPCAAVAAWALDQGVDGDIVISKLGEGVQEELKSLHWMQQTHARLSKKGQSVVARLLQPSVRQPTPYLTRLTVIGPLIAGVTAVAIAILAIMLYLYGDPGDLSTWTPVVAGSVAIVAMIVLAFQRKERDVRSNRVASALAAVFALVLVFTAFSLAALASRLQRRIDESSIRGLIAAEPQLIGGPIRSDDLVKSPVLDPAQLFEAQARLADFNGNMIGKAPAVLGLDNIKLRYADLRTAAKHNYVHVITKVEVGQHDAYVLGLTYHRLVGGGGPWERNAYPGEVWHLRRHGDSWKIALFYFNILPKSVDTVLDAVRQKGK